LYSEARSLVVVLGPTGVGKSGAALGLAAKFRGEIINADSMQVYRGFDIGTDKPTAADRKAVPHHLLDVADPADQFTAADFVAGALEAMADIHGRDRVPFIVGGTGLYIKALLDGLFPGPGRDPEVRSRLEAEAARGGLEALFRRLKKVDPVYALKIRARDRIRIVRALEVFETTGKPISEHFHDTESFVKGLRQVRVGLELDRAALVGRIEERVDRMFAAKLVEEVQSLLARGVAAEAPAFKGLGYKQVLAFLRSEIGLEEARDLVKRETRRYAKRQMTWFRKMSGIAWFRAGDTPALEDHVGKNIQ
jgi:tRNA dimethylallyltransferase